MKRSKTMYIGKSRRRKTISGKKVGFFIVAFAALGGGVLAFMPNAYEVTIGGQMIGAVEKKEFVETALQSVETQLEQHYNTEVNIEGVEDVKWVHASKKEIITPDYLASYIREHGKVEIEFRELFIDGKSVAIIPSDETVDELFEILKEEYHGDTELEAQFVNEVTTEPIWATEDELMDLEHLVDECMETTKKTITYEVVAGDSLSKIARKLDTNMLNIISANEGMSETSILNIGQEIKVNVRVPLLDVEVIEPEVVEPKEAP